MRYFTKRILLAAIIAASTSFFLFTYGIDPLQRILCPVLFDICVYQGNLLIETIYNMFYAITAAVYILALRYIAKAPLSIAVFASISSLLFESILAPFFAGLSFDFLVIQILLAGLGALSLVIHAAILTMLFEKKAAYAPFISAGIWLLYAFILWVILPSIR